MTANKDYSNDKKRKRRLRQKLKDLSTELKALEREQHVVKRLHERAQAELGS